MKTAKYILSVLVLLISAAGLWAADIDEILSRRPQAALLPPSDTVILYHGTTFTIHDDGRVDRQEHIVRYLRNLNAWDEYGDPHLAFDSERQELEILISRTHTTDGRKVDTTPNGFNPIVPFGLDKVADFTLMRQMVVTHLGIEHDAVTELKYVIRDKEPLYPWGWGEVLFGGPEPTLERELIVNAPRNAGLTSVVENGAPRAEIKLSGDTETHSWRMTDLKGVDLEEASSQASLFLPRVSFSTCPNWETFTAMLEKRFDEAVKQDGSLTDAVKHLEEISDMQMRLDSTVAFVADRIAVKRFDDLGFLLKYRPAGRTFSTGYGSPADLAVLCAVALKELGFNLEVFLLSPRILSLPGVTGDEVYSIYINEPSFDCCLDPTTGEIEYLIPDKVDYFGVWPASKPETSPASPYQGNRVALQLEVTFNEDTSAEGWVLIKTHGYLAEFEAARNRGAEELVESWTGDLFANPEVKNARILVQENDRVEVKADLSFPPVEETIDGLLRIPVPWNIGEIEGLLPHGLALHHPRRNVPVFLDNAGSVELNIKFHVPEAWDVVLPPQSYSANLTTVSVEREVAVASGEISVNEKITFPQAKIPVEDWGAWRRALLNAQKESSRVILLNIEG